MIETIEIRNYGPIKNASAYLTPLHAFIGPNDSGKSSLLRAIVAAVEPSAPFWPSTEQKSFFRFRFKSGGTFLRAFNGAAVIPVSGQRNEGASSASSGSIRSLSESVADEDRAWLAKGSKLIRLDPEALRQPGPLVSEDQSLFFVQNRGFGLPGALDVLNNRNDGSFAEISAEFVRLFSSAKRLRLLTVGPSAKTVAVDLKSGPTVNALQMSEGMLYYLAFAALRYLGAGALVAVEEPENGLHPARIAEVIRLLRAIAGSGTQVVIATHSPIVINALEPAEVSVVTRTVEAGTMVQRLSETANFEMRSRVYKPGELWVSYANGTDEGPLLDADRAAEVPK